MLFSLVLTGCNGQNNDKANEIKNDTITQIQPKTDIRVNKKYDADGNLIRYDSSYSYYYSNIENDTILKDSIFDNFRNYIKKSFIFSSNPFSVTSFFKIHYCNMIFITMTFLLKGLEKIKSE